jgi:hypothetical protein
LRTGCSGHQDNVELVHEYMNAFESIAATYGQLSVLPHNRHNWKLFSWNRSWLNDFQIIKKRLSHFFFVSTLSLSDTMPFTSLTKRRKHLFISYIKDWILVIVLIIVFLVIDGVDPFFSAFPVQDRRLMYSLKNDTLSIGVLAVRTPRITIHMLINCRKTNSR